MLETKHGITTAPACSTIGAILARHGLSVRRRRRPGAYPAPNDALTQPTQPNEVWTFDFKGWFELTSGVRCDPLTACDRFIHYVLALRAQPNQQFKRTLRTCRDLMRQLGVPQVIRSDLGSPFASTGLGRLSCLSAEGALKGSCRKTQQAGRSPRLNAVRPPASAASAVRAG